MQSDPLANQTICSQRQGARNDFRRSNFDDRLVFTKDSMKVRGRVIDPKHSDNDAIKAAQLRHEVARDGVLETAPQETCRLVSNKENQSKVQSRRSI